MLAWSVFLLILLAIAAVLCTIIVRKPDPYFTGRHTLICPETRQPVEVRVDTALSLRTLLTWVEEMRLQSCSRWPERENCGQECLLQVDTKPAVLNLVLRQFYAGKQCALCRRALTDGDWRLGRLAMLDEHGKLNCGGELPVREFPAALERYRPVCWTCHRETRAQRAIPAVLFKGDRRGRRPDPLLSE